MENNMLNNNYILVTKPIEEEKKEGFQIAQVEDSSVYTGIVYELPEIPVYMGNTQVKKGDKVIFAKYSPDTHLIQRDGVDYKYINTKDILELCQN
jgi:co-chaperonin GroES (HSP10)